MAHILCEISVRQNAAGPGAVDAFQLPMTQEQLADALGLTAVHVNRTLKQLEAEGLIARNKRAISVDDWEALSRAGDFNPSYLHLAA
jgi:CRP-like cAMP-binding protein